MTTRICIILIAMAAMLCSNSTAVTVKCSFSCESTDNDSTMMHYSYLKEPTLQENGYTLGYKTGSINYLANGNISFIDFIEYDDGQNVSDIDEEYGGLKSSVYRFQNVSFEGEKGISEFYGKGFFPSNKAISAWKKVRYDDLTYNMSRGILYLSGSSRIAGSQGSDHVAGSYNLGKSYNSSSIHSTAEVGMGPKKRLGSDYVFKYSANVENAVVETWDATGWTNRTGSRRIEWEETALMKGNLKINNTLIAEDLFFPAGDLEGDWLPCCIVGYPSAPKYCNGSSMGWPNGYTEAVLAPKQIYPTANTTQNCTEDCHRECLQKFIDQHPDCARECAISYNGSDLQNFSVVYTQACNLALNESEIEELERCEEDCKSKCFTCSESSCPGFECIFAKAGAEIYPSGAAAGDGSAIYKEGPAIRVSKTINASNKDDYSETQVTYEIHVFNNGSTKLTDVKLKDVLPDGLGLNKSEKATEAEPDPDSPGRTETEPIPYSIENRPTANRTNHAQNITWNLPDMDQRAEEYIYLTATIDPAAEGTMGRIALQNEVYVEGVFVNGDRNETVRHKAKVELESAG